MTSALDQAGIIDPFLVSSYERCRQINATHGRTYYLATMLLPPAKRPYVHALYGLARFADDIVDAQTNLKDKERDLTSFRAQFFRDLALGRSSHPICAAAIHTAIHWQIPTEHFSAFFDSMAMDLCISNYETYDDLLTYMHGSAAVIGLQMTPILEPSSDRAYRAAMDLGNAFQLANFIRDVGEDLDRGRIYLPLAELAAFGVSPADLSERIVTDQLRAALQFQIERVRDLQRWAAPGIDLLDPACQPCIRAASTLYCGIVDAVVDIDYQVFTTRASVSLRRRLSVAGAGWLESRRSRNRFAAHSDSAPEHPQ